MYAAFHGKPSEETVEFEEQEHFHENLAGLGVLVELRVHTVTGLDRAFNFEPFGPGQPLGSRTTVKHIDKRSRAITTTTGSGAYKGYQILKHGDGTFEVPQIDRESRFDTKRDAQRFIDDEVKYARNPSGIAKIREFVSGSHVMSNDPSDGLRDYHRAREVMSALRIKDDRERFSKIKNILHVYHVMVSPGPNDSIRLYRPDANKEMFIGGRKANPDGPVSSALKFAGDVSGLNYISRQAGKLDKRAGKAIGFKGNPKTIDGYPIVKKESEAYAVYDADTHQIIAYAPGHPWSISKTKALREKGSGHKVYYIGFPTKENGRRNGNTSTSTDAHSPTRTEVRSPTRTATSTSTDAYTSGNVTVTGGAGAGANTRVSIFQQKPTDPKAKTAGVRRGVRANPEPISTSTTLLTCNEEGTQLYFVGGDQSLDLDALKFSEIEQEKDLVTIGDCFFVSYLTQKDFDDLETICYEHELGEESGVLPQLIYDTRNKRLMLSGGEYHIERPMLETSPGIEN